MNPEEEYQLRAKSIVSTTLDQLLLNIPTVLIAIINEYVCSLDYRHTCQTVYERFQYFYISRIKWKSCFTSGIIHNTQFNRWEVRIPWEYLQYFNLKFKDGPKLDRRTDDYIVIAQHTKKDPYFRLFARELYRIIDLFDGQTQYIHRLKPITYLEAIDRYHRSIQGHTDYENLRRVLRKEPSYPFSPVLQSEHPACLEYQYFGARYYSEVTLVFKRYRKEIIQELKVIREFANQHGLY